MTALQPPCSPILKRVTPIKIQPSFSCSAISAPGISWPACITGSRKKAPTSRTRTSSSAVRALLSLSQSAKSKAIYANVGFQVTETLRLSGGLRYTKDDKDAWVNINDSLIEESNSRDWNETSWEIAAVWDMNERLNLYGTIQNGYQSGQYPPRPYCLFGNLDFTQPGNVSRPNCFEANDNVTATNYEIGLKGTPADTLQMSIAAFYTNYSDLPYQVSESSGGGFNTVNIIVDQTSKGWSGKAPGRQPMPLPFTPPWVISMPTWIDPNPTLLHH